MKIVKKKYIYFDSDRFCKMAFLLLSVIDCREHMYNKYDT